MKRQKQKQYSREERKDQIFEAVSQAFSGLTSYGIAKRIGMSVSPHLRSIIAEMVDSGELEWEEVDHRPNRTKFVFYPGQFESEKVG